MVGEEDTAAHHVEVEESGEGGKYADSQHGSERNRGSGGTMRKPVEDLGERGNAKGDNQIAEPTDAKPEGPLLQPRIDAGGEGDVGDFDKDDGKTAVRTGARQGREINHGAGSCAEKCAL